jgi:hypothetical protein
MMAEWLIGNGVEGSSCGPTELSFQHFPGGVEQSNEKSQSQ